MNHTVTVPMVVVDRASAHLLPHNAIPTAAVPNSAHTRAKASRLYVAAHTPPDFACRPRCRLLYCLAAASASLWDSKVVDPRQSSQCFSPTGLEFLPGGVWDICCLTGSFLPPPPTPLAALHRRFTPPHRTHRRTLSGHLADRGMNDADHLQTLSSDAWDYLLLIMNLAFIDN